MRFVAPVERSELVDHYRAASLVCVPSYNESFGLVAIEAQACGTPVVAANVGGLPTAVRDDVSGVLVDGHDPQDYAAVFERLLADPSSLDRLRQHAPEHAQQFGWARTAAADPGRLRRRRDVDACGRVGSGRMTTPEPSGSSPTREDVTATVRAALAERRGRCPRAAAGGLRLRPARASASSRRPASWSWATTRWRCTPSSAATPTRTTQGVYRWLLSRNLRLYGVAFGIDHNGDIYLDGRLSLAAVTAEELDRLLGSVLTYADESFNTILELGFASSIRKEWEWRLARGESTRNLEAFRGWLERDEESLRPIRNLAPDLADMWSPSRGRDHVRPICSAARGLPTL